MTNARVTAVRSRYGVWYWPLSVLLTLVFRTEGEVQPHRVVLRTENGREQVLQHFGTYRAAQRSAREYSADLERLGPAAFCERYHIPPAFLD